VKREVVGLIPAAGRATRIAPLPCSKEVYPVGFGIGVEGGFLGPKVVCHYLLEKMCLAGITKAYIILRKGKWDIPTYLGDGAFCNMNLAYLMLGLPYGVPYTIDQAYKFVKESVVAFGFPDILFEPDDAFMQLLYRQSISDADAVLGIFPADRTRKVDMVDIDDEGQIREIEIKPEKTNLRHTWGIAAWGPTFTNFMHNYLLESKKSAATQPALYMGDVFQTAISKGLLIEGLKVSDKPFIDIGTGHDLLRAIKRLLDQK
jgi:glucose-1-phosphate thymidylyltransferase